MATKKNQLEPLELQPWRVLIIAAHPGDIEYAAAAAAAKWTSEGAEVVYLIASRGETSLPGIEPEQAALIRSGEQSAAAAVAGVQIVDVLDVDDGTIEPTVALRRAIVAEIRRFGPDVMVIMNHHDYEADGTHNLADHRAVGVTSLDAIDSAANQWAFRGVGSPHTVDIVLVANSPLANHAIDVSGFEQAAHDALAEHKQHIAAIATHPMADPAWLQASLKKTVARLPSSSAAIAVERIDFAQGQACQPYIVKQVEDEGGQLRVMKLPKHAKSQTPSRARNAAPRNASPKKAPRKISTPSVALPATVTPTGTMKFKARLEQKGKAIGIEIPDRVMSQVGGGKRPEVDVDLNSTEFRTFIGMNAGKPFVPVNAERRKKAAIEINDTFFVTLTLSSANQHDTENRKATDVAETSTSTKHAKAPRRRRPRSGS